MLDKCKFVKADPLPIKTLARAEAPSLRQLLLQNDRDVSTELQGNDLARALAPEYSAPQELRLLEINTNANE